MPWPNKAPFRRAARWDGVMPTHTGYGLGVQVGDRNGHRYIEHSGEVSGFVAENIVFPEDKAAVTVLTNEDASSAAGAWWGIGYGR